MRDVVEVLWEGRRVVKEYERGRLVRIRVLPPMPAVASSPDLTPAEEIAPRASLRDRFRRAPSDVPVVVSAEKPSRTRALADRLRAKASTAPPAPVERERPPEAPRKDRVERVQARLSEAAAEAPVVPSEPPPRPARKSRADRLQEAAAAASPAPEPRSGSIDATVDPAASGFRALRERFGRRAEADGVEAIPEAAAPSQATDAPPAPPVEPEPVDAPTAPEAPAARTPVAAPEEPVSATSEPVPRPAEPAAAPPSDEFVIVSRTLVGDAPALPAEPTPDIASPPPVPDEGAPPPASADVVTVDWEPETRRGIFARWRSRRETRSTPESAPIETPTAPREATTRVRRGLPFSRPSASVTAPPAPPPQPEALSPARVEPEIAPPAPAEAEIAPAPLEPVERARATAAMPAPESASARDEPMVIPEDVLLSVDARVDDVLQRWRESRSGPSGRAPPAPREPIPVPEFEPLTRSAWEEKADRAIGRRASRR